MNRSLARAAPIRFLIGVAALWTMTRGVALTGWGPAPSLPPAPKRGTFRPSARPRSFAGAMPDPGGTAAARPLRAIHAPGLPRLSAGPAPEDSGDTPFLLKRIAAASVSGHGYERASGLPGLALTAGPPSARRWSGSAWAFLRGGGRATTLSPGQIGGGQAGARIVYRLAGRLSATARISTAIGGIRQTEASIGFDWTPIARLPIHLMAERRVAIDSGGRNAWTLGAAGGIDDIRIAPGWRLDAYGEAGVVGARRRDLYADGALRIARAIEMGGGKTLALGGGIWGAAQPGTARLDIGPSAVLRLPVARRAVAIALDWRERTAGHARPGSGVALTVATDF